MIGTKESIVEEVITKVHREKRTYDQLGVTVTPRQQNTTQYVQANYDLNEQTKNFLQKVFPILAFTQLTLPTIRLAWPGLRPKILNNRN